MIHIGSCSACLKEVADGDVPSTNDNTLVRCPHCGEEFARTTFSLREVPELISTCTPVDADQEKMSGTLSTAGADKVPDTFLESPIDMPVVTSFSAQQEYDAQISTEPRAVQSGSARSFLRQLVGVVGGGVIGLTLGYFILLWIGGPQKDFLKVGRRLPRWAVPAAFHPIDLERDLDRGNGGRSLADLLETDEDEVAITVPAEPEGLPPAPLPETQTRPAEPPLPQVAIIDPPILSTADLDAALRTAADVRLSLVAGETSDPALRPLKEAAYGAFAGLAEALAFATPTPGRDAEHATLLTQAAQLLTDTLANQRMMDQLGPLAETWLDSPERGNSGIVVSGVVNGSHMGIDHQRGIVLELAGTSRILAVVAPFEIGVPRGARVVVVGSLINEPQERIRGYTGSAEQVVWAALVLE